MNKKRTFGKIEVIFDVLYLSIVVTLGCFFLLSAQNSERWLFGVMALVLVAGDACHLIPRIFHGLNLGEKVVSERSLGIGKMLTSLGMTVFYLILWQIGLLYVAHEDVAVMTKIMYALAAVRILLCLLPQNQWGSEDASQAWNLYRNIPFTLMGGIAVVVFFLYRMVLPWDMENLWLAIFLSFAFYLPVVFGAKKYPMLGMLMLPKSCVYIWIITMGF